MNPDIFSPNLTLKELFDRWPQAIPVFLHHRMICVGCSMSIFDTLADAMTNYGLSEAAFQAELAAAVGSGQPSASASTNR